MVAKEYKKLEGAEAKQMLKLMKRSKTTTTCRKFPQLRHQRSRHGGGVGLVSRWQKQKATPSDYP